MHNVIRESHTERQTTLLVRANGHVYDTRWEQHEVDLEEIVLAYLGYKPGAAAVAAAAPRAGRAMTWVAWRLQRTETLIVARHPGAPRCAAHPHRDQRWPTPTTTTASRPASSPTPAPLRRRDRVLLSSASNRSGTSSNLFTLIPGLIGVAARCAVHLRPRTRHLPAQLDAEHHPRPLAGRQARRVPIATAILAGGALILLFTWWRTPQANLDGRLDTGVYDTTGTVVIGYTLFALGLALALGALWRRSAASLTVAFIAYFATRIFVDYKVRDHLVAPLKATWQGVQQPAALYNAHVLNLTGTVHGHQVISRQRRLPRRPRRSPSPHRVGAHDLPRHLHPRQRLLAPPTHRDCSLHRRRRCS